MSWIGLYRTSGRESFVFTDGSSYGTDVIGSGGAKEIWSPWGRIHLDRSHGLLCVRWDRPAYGMSLTLDLCSSRKAFTCAYNSEGEQPVTPTAAPTPAPSAAPTPAQVQTAFPMTCTLYAGSCDETSSPYGHQKKACEHVTLCGEHMPLLVGRWREMVRGGARWKSMVGAISTVVDRPQ